MKHFVYIIESCLTDRFYIGYTNDPARRVAAYKHAFNKGQRSPLYDCMRKYGFDNFEMVLVDSFDTKEEAFQLEIELISLGNNLNLAPGGEGGFVVQDIDSWKSKLSESRKDRKPALGMSHTDENKKKFSKAGKKRWDMYGRYPDNVINLSFKDAKEKYGISKTHYYRLLKQVKINDLG